MNRLGLFLLGLGHLAVDINPGALPALLPIVFLDLKLSYTTAALVVTVGNVTSSIVQPLFGVLSDRLARGWLVPLGCLLGTAGLALAGLAPTYGLLLAAVVVSSLGVAIFHPEAVRTANEFAGPRKATGMALFTVGGNFGVALGPIMMGALLAAYGRPGTMGWLVFAACFPPILWLAMRRVGHETAPSRATAARPVAAAGPTRRGALALLLAVIFFRQWAQTGLTVFIPLYFVTHLGEEPVVANQLLSALLFGSVAGTLLGGPLADRWGRKPVLSVSLFLTVPLLLLFLRGGPASALVLFAAGTVMLSTASVVVVMGQELLPRSTGLAAGLTIGFASGLAGLGGALLGGVADSVGIAQTMLIVCLLPLPGAVLSLWLPDTLERSPAVARARPA